VLTPRLLAQAGNFLAPRGRLILVANRHLPYARWLEESFRSHRLLDGDQRYHVFLAEN
jgi:16S rRNA G1207 methylase RsmC